MWIRSAGSCTSVAQREPGPLCAASQRTLLLLREQWKSIAIPRCSSRQGRDGLGAKTATQPISRTTLQVAFRLALKASGVTKAAHIHTLRHSYASILLEARREPAARSKSIWASKSR